MLQIFSSVNASIEVWAYGSRVNGTAHDGSDLDLVLFFNEQMPNPAAVMNALAEKIRNSSIPILVEIRNWSQLPENFKKNIV
ncbi:MAG: nucleotidyltransferase domain-containing protein [Parafilimonas sp.]